MGKSREGRKKFPILINKKIITLVVAIEMVALIALGVFFGKYARVAPSEPTQYADVSAADYIDCADGMLIVNSVSVAVPNDDNTKYSISYAWSKDDKDYPSVPRAAVASYMKAPKDDNSTQSENESLEFEISLYKDASYNLSEIVDGRTADTWFSDWAEEEVDGIVKKRYSQGNINGFLISSLEADDFSGEYRSYKFSFAVSEAKAVSVYSLEGTCYDSSGVKAFKDIMNQAIHSIETGKSST